MKKAIVLIEDDEDDQLLFKDALREILPGIDCIVFGYAEEALKNMPAIYPSPALIVLDLNMPQMNGFDCLREIMRHSTLRKLPVVVLTTSHNPVDEETALNLGAQRFMRKQNQYHQYVAELQKTLSHF